MITRPDIKIETLGGAVRAINVDLHDDASCFALGRIVADECVVLVRQPISETRLYEIQTLWGQPATSIVDRYVGEGRIRGRHWRSLLVNLTRVAQATEEIAQKKGLARVSYTKDQRGKPKGLFTNGELDWHSDQQAYMDNQTVVGLLSLWGTENSQTTFLCTAKAYNALNHEDRTMVDELITVWNWDGGAMSEDLIDEQMEIVRYNMVPHSNMECPLLAHTASGIAGIRFPSHCFSHFRGMSKSESESFKRHLWGLLNRDEYIYVHDWRDGEVIFMDQNITLHARPTNVQDGDTRTLARMISYLDKLFPGNGPLDYVMCNGEKYDHDTFAEMVDTQRRADFQLSSIA